MKKSSTLFVCVSFFMLLATMNLNAQCAIVGENDGVSVTIPISCSFPIMINTGNPQADAEDYDAQKSLWVQNFPEDYQALSGLSSFSYFQLHQADFDALSAEKQAAVLANPEQYHVIP